MKRNEMRKFSAMAFVFGLAVFCVGATKSYGAETSVCATGVAEPPFLSYGVDPNVLLMIDNSGSMYDPAYIQTTPLDGGAITSTNIPPQCYDESYGRPDPLTPTIAPTYAGYFEKDSWYSYNLGAGKFEKLGVAPGSCQFDASDAAGKYVCVDLIATTPKTVGTFAAKGNYLNWVVSSKFDIQKRILTGGKYDSTNGIMMTEARGCEGRRFVKQVTLAQVSGGIPYKLALAVRGPMEIFEGWHANTDYTAGTIVQYTGMLFKAKINFKSAAAFDITKWEIYKETRWYPNQFYPQGAAVYDVASESWYWTSAGGTSLNTTELKYDTAIKWEPYHGAEIEIYDIKVGGFNVGACQRAITELSQDSVNLGQVKFETDGCMGYTGGSSTEEGDQQAALNQSVQDCWQYNKNGTLTTGAVTRAKQGCERLYGWVAPSEITTWNSGYVCYGSYSPTTDKSGQGYVGRCWEPAAGTGTDCVPKGCGTNPVGSRWIEGSGTTREVYGCRETDATHSGGELYKCTENNLAQCAVANAGLWTLQQACTGGGDLAATGWTNDNFGIVPDPVGDQCVEQALKDFCAIMSVPEVIDPSDSTGITGKTWNTPSMLVDSGVLGQLDKPLATMKGRIAETVAPEGIIQRNADKIRIGVMRFNDNGAKTECGDALATPSSSIKYDCPSINRDGAKVISDIVDTSPAHTAEVVTAINGIEANSWTPLGEAMFTAIGYYTQNDKFKCQEDAPLDFTMGADPVQYWCQNNHIILITDGSSTADRNSTMKTTVTTTPFIRDLNDLTKDVEPGCTDGLYGSTYLDNFTYFAAKEPVSSLYPINQSQLPASDGVMKDKQKVKTHIVVSGTMRVTGTTECSPDVILKEAAENAKLNAGDTLPLYESKNYDDLESNLAQVFAEIRAGASAGSAASVISSSRGGEGAIYQAIFWPSKTSSTDPTISVKWAGEVHSLFIDTNGHMYEDTNNDRELSDADRRVTIYFDNTALISKGCYAVLNSDGTCNAADQVDMDAVRYLWSANDWLAKISNSAFASPGFYIDDQKLNRTPFISDQRRRYIFTWNDLDNDGIVDETETLPFVSKSADGNATDWSTSTLAVAGNRRPVTNDFNAADDVEVNKIVDWIRGVEVPGLRSRTVYKKMNVGGTIEDKEVVWRLGDVVHSTPTAVARPMEGLHLLYNDTSYAKFVARWANRRHMAYFGANDGMMHAVNGGFYDDNDKKFYLTPPDSITGIHGVETGVPELGAEMWAYVPYNLLPHLQCLTNPGYNHKFYVDQRPRVFDARIFPDDGDSGIHPGGWGTVLVGSMRFGGARLEADRLSGDTNSSTDNRTFTSSYFLLDITNPEAPPVLLGEFTMLEGVGVDLGFTTSSPTPVVMKKDATADDPTTVNEWYLLMGSGPTASDPSDGIGTLPVFNSLDAIKGYSEQKPKVAVFPLKWLTTDKHAFRIPDTPPTSTNSSGVFTLGKSSNGFVSDMISVDYDLDPNYMTDAVYFGTVEHGTISDSAAVPGDHSYDNVWDGQLYRIVMRELSAGKQVVTTPDKWAGLTPPYDATGFLPLFKADQPITAAPAVGTDRYNYWIYFGTGRFFDGIDKPDDAQQSFYGIKEPKDCITGKFTWPTIAKAGLINVSNVLVHSATSAAEAQLFCTPDDLAAEVRTTTTCLPKDDITNADITNLGSLITHIAGNSTTLGTSCVDNTSPADGILETPTGKDGWYRDFPMITRPRERNVGQATLLGGLITFTTYQPYADLCQQEGLAYLYGLYYQTGTAWYKSVFGSTKGLDGDRVRESISLGRGLATTPNLHVGSGEGPTAFIQTSTGEIIEIPQEPPLNIFKTGRQSWRER